MKFISKFLCSVKRLRCLRAAVLFIFSLLLVQSIGMAPFVLRANANESLSAPTEVKWSTSRFSTATWKSVDGADFYEVVLYHNGDPSDEVLLVDSVLSKTNYSANLKEEKNRFPGEKYTFKVRAAKGDYDDEEAEIIYSAYSESALYDETTVDESTATLDAPLNPIWFEDEDGINIDYYTNNYFGYYYVEICKDNNPYTIIYDGEQEEYYTGRIAPIDKCGNGKYKFRVLVSPIEIMSPSHADFESGVTSIFSDEFEIKDCPELPNAPSNIEISDSGILSFDTNNAGATDINYHVLFEKPDKNYVTFTITNVTTESSKGLDLSAEIGSPGVYKIRVKAARVGEEVTYSDFYFGAVSPEEIFDCSTHNRLSVPNSPYWDGITLRWDPVLGAATYIVQLEIFDGKTPLNMGRIPTIKTNSYTISDYYINTFKKQATRLKFKARVMAVPENIKTTGRSTYSAYAELLFPVEITSDMITLSADSFVCDGTPKEPTVTVKYNNETLVSGADYTVTYSNNVNAGTASATVTGIAPFRGSVTINYTITEKLHPIGSKETVSDNVYEITDDTSVSYSGTTSGKKTQTIPSSVDIDGKSYTVTTIEKDAFKDNKSLSKVTIPKTVTKISSNAFSGCKNLKKISINGNTLKSIEKGAFNNIKKNATITITAKNKKTFDKIVKKIKKSTNVKKLKFKMKKGK